MEETAKAPLNQAHFLDRKADSYSKKRLYEKAIQCREQAIENLKLVKNSVLSDDTVSSLDIQISFHNNQIKNLHQQLLSRESKMSTVPPASSVETTSVIVTSDPPENPVARRSHHFQTDIESAIKDEIIKCDLLLESLVSQQSQAEQTAKHDIMISSAIKLPKPIEQVLEELQCHNDQLKVLMGSLFEELEALKLENSSLKQQVAQLQKGGQDVPVVVAVAKNAEEKPVTPSGTLIELPPLEPFKMPEIPSSIKPRVRVMPRKSRVSE